MTRVLMNWEDMTLVAEGHAGMGDPGKDIVCAGASVLVYALLNTLLDAERRGRVELDLQVLKDSGSMRIHAKAKSGEESRIRAYFKVAVMGYKALAEHYPNNVSIGEVTAHGNL